MKNVTVSIDGHRSRPAAVVRRLEENLRAAGTAERAAGSKAYLKSDLDFLGADTAALRREVKALLRELPGLDRAGLLALVETLWSRRIFECRSAAVEMLIARVDLLETEDLGLLEGLIRDSKTWALVDALAPRVVGPLVTRHRELEAVLDRWAEDEDFWVRRAALLADLVPLRRGEGDFERFARYADRMLEEREFFVRKAIGWVLREVGKKNPGRVHSWLLPRAGRASGVTVREAVKYLRPEQRESILAASGVAARSVSPEAP